MLASELVLWSFYSSPPNKHQIRSSSCTAYLSYCDTRKDQSSYVDWARTRHHLRRKNGGRKILRLEIDDKIEFFTLAILCFRIKGVSCAAALRSDTAVAADCVVAALRLQALVIIDLTFVNVLAGIS